MFYINIKTLLSLILVVVFEICYSQISVPYSVYKEDFQYVNPSCVGLSKNLKILACVRSQWSELERSPKRQYISLSKPFIKHNFAFGFSVVNDTYHINSETSFFGNFAYYLNIDNNFKLCFGLKSGGSFLNIDFNSLRIDDVAFSNNLDSGFSPNIGSGIFLKSDNFFAGLSIPRFFSVKYYESKSKIYRDIHNPQLFVNCGYNFNYIHNLNRYKIVPTVLLSHPFGNQTNIEFGSSFTYNDMFEIAIANRFNECFTTHVSFNFSDIFNIAYSYEKSISGLGMSSHQLVLLLSFRNSIDPIDIN